MPVTNTISNSQTDMTVIERWQWRMTDEHLTQTALMWVKETREDLKRHGEVCHETGLC